MHAAILAAVDQAPVGKRADSDGSHWEILFCKAVTRRITYVHKFFY